MPSLRTAFVGIVLALLATPVVADAALYTGKFKGVPGSSVEMRIAKVGEDRTLRKFFYEELPLNCAGPDTDATGDDELDAPVRRNGVFRAQAPEGLPPGTITYRGRISANGQKVLGKVRIATEYSDPFGACVGTEEFVARKAAPGAER